MAWLSFTRKKDGSLTWWVRDIRGGRQISIPADSRADAEQKKEQYEIRRDLEKEGYDDKYEQVADNLFGKKEA